MSEIFRTEKRSSRLVTIFAISLAILLVAYPILRVYVPGPSWARWMLAHAANERIAGRIENALSALDKSYQLDPEIVYDSQYWKTRLEIAFGRSPVQNQEVELLVGHAVESMQSSTDPYRRFVIAKVLAATLLEEKRFDLAADLLDQSYKRDPAIVQDLPYWIIRMQVVFGRSPALDHEVERVAEHAIETLKGFKDASQRSLIAMTLASTLLKKEYCDLAINVLVELLESPKKRTAEQNNLLAYCRSLSMTDLKQALVEIDLALKKDKNPALLDTKGWVLYQSGKYEEALSYANQAVSGFSDEIKSNAPELFKLLTDTRAPALFAPKSKIESSLVTEGQESRSPTKSSNTIQAALAEMAKNFAVVRLHRVRILEGLGRNEEAKQDLDWIRSLGIEDFSDLY
jgi:tetratricopeptide (TPR) repeat protein